MRSGAQSWAPNPWPTPPVTGRRHRTRMFIFFADNMQTWDRLTRVSFFNFLMAWREPKTQTRSRAQGLSGAAKLTMVRLALRALDPEEQEAASTEKALASAAEEERKQHAYREQRRADKFSKIRSALSVGEDIELAGINVLYDIPEKPDVICKTEEMSAKKCAQEILKQI